jgi:cell division protease FtsH
MVTRWGMSNLGSAFRTDEEQPFLGYEIVRGRDSSEATAARIDQEVYRMIEERHEFVHKLLTNARERLSLLAETLLKEETIDQEELIRILGPRPESNGESQ